MPRADLGATLLIANPTSHSGRGAQAVQVVRRFFAAYEAATTRFALRLTEAPGDGERFAAHAAGYDTVLALGGDGVIHEVVNGLMAIAPSERPRLGIIPFGSDHIEAGDTVILTARAGTVVNLEDAFDIAELKK